MKDEENPVAPASHSFQTSGCDDVDEHEANDANNDHGICKAFLHNSSLHEIVDVPTSVAQ
jgi:hypothetical protein